VDDLLDSRTLRKDFFMLGMEYRKLYGRLLEYISRVENENENLQNQLRLQSQLKEPEVIHSSVPSSSLPVPIVIDLTEGDEEEIERVDNEKIQQQPEVEPEKAREVSSVFKHRLRGRKAEEVKTVENERMASLKRHFTKEEDDSKYWNIDL